MTTPKSITEQTAVSAQRASWWIPWAGVLLVVALVVAEGSPTCHRVPILKKTLDALSRGQRPAESVLLGAGSWRPVGSFPHVPGFDECLAATAASPFWAQVAEEYDKLPRLAIAVNSHVDRPYMAEAFALETYASRHGYYFHHSVINNSVWEVLPGGQKAGSGYIVRWHRWQQRLLGRYQSLLFVDGDTVVLNFANNAALEAALQFPEHIVFHVRLNYEFNSAAVLMRSTPFSYCFLEHWVQLSTDVHRHSHGNWDNGDMIQTLLELADPPLTECLRQRTNYVKGFMTCLRDTVAEWPSRLAKVPVRWLMPMEHGSFFKSFEGPQTDTDNSLYGFLKHISPATNLSALSSGEAEQVFHRLCAFPSDVLGGGWKGSREAWPLDASHALANNASALDIPPFCQQLTAEQELAIAKRMCFWRHPACTDASTGVNHCLAQPMCAANPNRWQYFMD